MIKSFGDKESEKIWNGIRSKKLPNEIQDVARRKLRIINNALDVNDLRIPPAKRLEKPKAGLHEHITNILREKLAGLPVVAKFATTASDGKLYQIEY